MRPLQSVPELNITRNDQAEMESPSERASSRKLQPRDPVTSPPCLPEPLQFGKAMPDGYEGFSGGVLHPRSAAAE